MSATPRPWKVDDSKPYQLAVIQDNADGIGICEMYHPSWEGVKNTTAAKKNIAEIKANAALIVAAVNSYVAMQEALEFAHLAIKSEKTLQASRGESIAAQLGLADEKIQAALRGGKGKV